MFKTFCQEKTWRNEIGGEIPFTKEISIVKKIIKEDKYDNKKGQTSQENRRVDPFQAFESFFHSGLNDTFKQASHHVVVAAANVP